MLTDKDWEELKAAYQMILNPHGLLPIERMDTRHDSGAMSAIYRVGSVIRIDIKEVK